MTHNWIRIQLAAVSLLATSCARTPHEAPAADEFMQAFEHVQLTEDLRGLITSSVGDDGRVTIYGTATVPMDRFVFIWGESGPAVPVFLSSVAAAKLAILEAHADNDRDRSREEAQQWAWRRMHEPAEAPPK